MLYEVMRLPATLGVDQSEALTCPEILHGSVTWQTHDTPQHLANRGCDTTILSIMCGVRVDGKRRHASVHHKATRS